jgi:hypothetical protein
MASNNPKDKLPFKPIRRGSGETSSNTFKCVGRRTKSSSFITSPPAQGKALAPVERKSKDEKNALRKHSQSESHGGRSSTLQYFQQQHSVCLPGVPGVPDMKPFQRTCAAYKVWLK